MTPVNILDTGKLLFLEILAARLRIVLNRPFQYFSGYIPEKQGNGEGKDPFADGDFFAVPHMSCEPACEGKRESYSIQNLRISRMISRENSCHTGCTKQR